MNAPVPARIQLRRTRGWRMPAGAVKVDRTTPWGNPYVIGMLGIPDAATAVEKFRRLLARPALAADHVRFHLTCERIRAELAGKDLACWCPPGSPCHADVLLAIANASPSFDPQTQESCDVLP